MARGAKAMSREIEMLRTFNCGIGMVAIVKLRCCAGSIATCSRDGGETVVVLGEVAPAGARTASSMTAISISHGDTQRVAILISGRGSNMAALIDAAKAEATTRPKSRWWFRTSPTRRASQSRGRLAFRRAPSISKPFGKDRAAFEARLQAALDDARIELICLAGFMRLFTAEFVQRWAGKMLNIHPSLLPAFKGLDPHGQALRAGVKLSGATVHFVSQETDAGPIVMQGAIGVAGEDTPDTLSARVLAVEHRIYPAALRMVASGQVTIEGDVCRVAATAADGALISPRP